MKDLKNNMDIFEEELLEKEDLSRDIVATEDASLKGDDKNESVSKSIAERLVDLVLRSGSEIYLDEQEEPHITLPEKPLVGYPICGAAFSRWIRGRYWEEYKKSFSTECLNQAIGTLEGQAFRQNKIEPLFNRVARKERVIYYDLGDDRQVVRIDENGWYVLSESPVRFRRFKHQQAQVLPIAGGDLSQVLQFINLRSDRDKLLFLTYLVAVLIPDIPRAILVHIGDQGAAKSTAMRVVRSLIDPSRSELLSPPMDINQLGQLANHHFCLYFDNLSVLNDELSDIICRLATGIGFSKRKLYTDDEDIIFNQRVAIGLNGVNLVARKADVLDRCLILSLERIPDDMRLGEEEFWQSFLQKKPLLLGALFSTLSHTLKISRNIVLPKKPRMADYARYAASAAVAIGESAEVFLSAFEENTSRQNQAAIESSPVAQTILEFMVDKNEWAGLSSELYGLLKQVAEKANLPIGGADGFPKGANTLWKKIKVIRPNLQSLGINVTKGEKSVGSTVMIIKAIMNSKNAATTATTATKSDVSTSHNDSISGNMAAMAVDDRTLLDGKDHVCRTCGGTEYWQRPDGEEICSICHPPSSI